MKTHLTTLLLLLLVFAGSFSGLAQTDTLKPGLPDEKVIRFRAELVDALENDEIEEAQSIKNILNDPISLTNNSNYIAQNYTDKTSLVFFMERNLNPSFVLKPPDNHSTDKKPTHKSPKPWEGLIGIGSVYKYGIYSGKMKNVFSDYRAIKPFTLSISRNRFYGDIGFSFFGAMGKMSQTKFLDTSIEGDYYGQFCDFYFSLGYRIFKFTYITPIASFNVQSYSVYAIKISPFSHPSDKYNATNSNKHNIASIGPGLISNFILFKSADNFTKLSLQLWYKALFVTSENQYNLKGLMHEYSIGIIFLIGSDNTSKKIKTNDDEETHDNLFDDNLFYLDY